jgi:hypothetical protein
VAFFDKAPNRIEEIYQPDEEIYYLNEEFLQLLLGVDQAIDTLNQLVENLYQDPLLRGANCKYTLAGLKGADCKSAPAG